MSFRQVDSRSRLEPGPSPRRWMVGATVVFGTIGAVAGGIDSLNQFPTDVAGMDQAGVSGATILGTSVGIVFGGASIGAMVGVVCGLALIGLVRLVLRLRRQRTSGR